MIVTRENQAIVRKRIIHERETHIAIFLRILLVTETCKSRKTCKILSIRDIALIARIQNVCRATLTRNYYDLESALKATKPTMSRYGDIVLTNRKLHPSRPREFMEVMIGTKSGAGR